MRTSSSCRILLAAAALAALAALAPSPVRAQEPTAAPRPATHTVKRGDTLWDLAQQYLGDAFQWPQIYQLNTEIIKDPHWIYPDQVLRIPGGTEGVSGGGTAAAVPGGDRRAAVTAFNLAANAAARGGVRSSISLREPRPAVLRGDYEGSPFVWAPGGPSDVGQIVAMAEPAGMAGSSGRRPVQYHEDVTVSLPAGASVGSQLLAFQPGPVLTGQGQVYVPTGILTVRELTSGGRARASLIRSYVNVALGQSVIVLEPLPAQGGARPVRVEFGAVTRVAWVQNASKLPTTGAYLILENEGSAGLVPGDQLSLRRRPALDRDGTMPEEEIAVAQVTKVTKWGATAMVLENRDAGVAVGMRAHVSAKMP
ncbi:MAG: LysM peptidoglycan-binding domain-containing protein [Gemmatimonadetes bacterium]|nr:LysM peptidoglycan-binding domain-containing protein [Gemmatimonadota bacterium]